MPTPVLIGIVALAVLIALWVAAAFNRLVRHRNLVQEAWSGIEVQLRRRYNLIPNLVRTVQGYSLHERSLFEKVTEMRSRTIRAESLRARESTENALTQLLKSLFAVVEAYPQLKADQHYLDLQRQLAEIEDQIQMARRYYNGTVRDYNIRVESFPSNLVARAFRFGRREFFQVETATARDVPAVEV